MIEKDAEFQKRLLATFRVEADEHLKGMASGLLALEKAEMPEERQKLIETVFREAHSLKGAARSVGLHDIETLCQSMEGLFASLKRQEMALAVGMFDTLQKAIDCLERLLSDSESAHSPEEKAFRKELMLRLEGATGKGPISGAETAHQPAPTAHLNPVGPAPETVRVSTKRLASVMLQAEEMLSAKLSAAQHTVRLRKTATSFRQWEGEWAKVSSMLTDIRNPHIVSFLSWNYDFVRSLRSEYDSGRKSFERDSYSLGIMVNDLLEDMKKVLMFPFSSLFEILPKMVRDLTREAGKEADLRISGAEIEIDRRILEEMKDPLIHLIRNCVDHGIERPDERQIKGKPGTGTISIEIGTRDDKVEIIVSDDGAGIGTAKLRSAVEKTGLVPKEKLSVMKEDEVLQYAFQSGVSTSPIITEISGRGLGLAIVREKVEKFGGTVTISSKPDSGTVFSLILPLTVATFRGILLRIRDRLFVIPATYVERAARVKVTDIRTVENRETISFGGAPVSLSRLEQVLELPGGDRQAWSAEMAQTLIVNASGVRIAFLVDEVLGEQEVLLKNLGPQLSRVRNVSGATVLGSGKVVPILNVPDLIKSAQRSNENAMPVISDAHAVAGQKKSVIVVEDSITSRTLIRNILESAGYEVSTAVDGLDAFSQLKGHEFDLVVSDVDMPRMNGFELAAKIRDDKKLSEIPVVLVTALQSREDREKGIDAGASAYIVKSSFDQSNLLETIRRLI